MDDTAEPTVNVYDPESDELGSIPHSQLAFAKQQGLQEASAEQLHKYSQEQKFGGAGQQLLTGLEGAASAGTFGLSTGLERAVGVDPEDIKARREVNPIAHGAGQLAGLVGSSLLVPGGGAAGALEGAGSFGAKALGLGAAEGTASKIAQSAVKGAVETMMFEGGDEVSKLLSSSNPNEVRQITDTALANIGISGLIGGGLGGVIGSINPLWKATLGKKAEYALADMANEASDIAVNKEARQLSNLPEGYHQRTMVDEAAGILKPNAEEIKSAASRLGFEPSVGTISDSHFIQDLEDNLIKRPTIYGQKAAKETMKTYESLNKAGLKTLRDATTKSEFEVGKEIKEGIIGKLKQELGPIESKYAELEPHFKAMDVSGDLKKPIIDNLMATGEKDAASIAEEVNSIKNVDDIKRLRTKVNARLTDAYKGGYRGAAEEIPVLQETKNALTKLREDAIEVASKNTGIEAAEAKGISAQTIDEVRGADKAYREFKGNLKKFGVEAGLGNLGTARQLVEKFAKLSDEQFASRLFDTGDLNQLKYIKDKFPEQFELARRYKLKDILEKSVSAAQGRNSGFDIGKYLNQLSDVKMGPEARDLLMAGNSQSLQDIKTIYRAMPGNANPSGTAAAMAMGHLFSPQGIVDNASDAIKYAVLKRLPRIMEAASVKDSKAAAIASLLFLKSGQPIESEAFKSMVDLISHTIKGENLIGKSVGSVFKAGQQVLATKLLPDDKSRDKLDKKLKELQTNVNPLFEVGGRVASYMPGHGAALSESAARAVNYLNSLRPNVDKKSPLDTQMKANPVAQAKYNRALDIAEQPMMALSGIKEGKILPEDIVSMKTLYPGLYERVSSKLMSGVMEAASGGENIPYKTRLGLSMFLNEPLDSTMTPQSILAMHASTATISPMQQGEAPQGHKGSMKNINKLAGAYQTPGQAREAQKLKG